MNADSWRYFNDLSPSLNQKFTSKNCQNQYFTLPSSLITYISTCSCVIFQKNVSKPCAVQYFGLPKLLKTCKYFLLRFKTIPINSCIIEDDHLILGGYNSKISYKYPVENFLCKIISNNLRLSFSEMLSFVSERTTSMSLSMIMEKTAVLVIQKLHLRKQFFTFNEFSFLTQSPLLFDVIFDDSFVWLNDKTILPVERIIERLPNVGVFDYIERVKSLITSFTPFTLYHLTLFKRTQKFNRFWLSQIPPQRDIDIKLLSTFIINHSFSEYKENTFTFKFNENVDNHSKLILSEELSKITTIMNNVFVNVL